MQLNNDTMLDFIDVLIKPKKSSLKSRSDVDLERTFYFPNSKQEWTGIPIIASNMDTIGTYQVYQVLSQYKILTALHKFHTLEDYKEMELDKEYFMVSTGISNHDYINLVNILDNIDVKFICIDVANGYMDTFSHYCKRIRKTYPDKIIVAGNVVTSDIVEELINDCGVDIVKVGIGSGACCLTRLKAGVGVPQFSAILECSKHNYSGYIISDGGITCPGDVSKAFGAGADFVMIGGRFGGHDENPGELFEENGRKYKLCYGMSSEHAMKKYYGKMNKYRSSEGRVAKVEYKGRLEDTVNDYLGGIRSCCTYTNSSNIEELMTNCEFIQVNRQLNTIYN